jgi:hypothetical protein
MSMARRPQQPACGPRASARLDVIELRGNYSRSPRPGRDEYADPGNGALIARLLREQRPDIVHVAHTMKLGAEAMRHCEALGIPVVVTLCDYWFLCPRHTLLRSDGRLCEGPAHLDDCRRCLRDTHPEAMFQLYARPTGLLTAPLHRRLQRHDQARWLPYLRAPATAGPSSPCRNSRGSVLSPTASRLNALVLPHGLRHCPTCRLRPRQRSCTSFHRQPRAAQGRACIAEALRQLPDLPLRCTLTVRCTTATHTSKPCAGKRADPRVAPPAASRPEDIWRVLDAASVLALPSWYENEPCGGAALHRGVPVLTSALAARRAGARWPRRWLLPPVTRQRSPGCWRRLPRSHAWRVRPTPDLGMDTHSITSSIYTRGSS